MRITKLRAQQILVLLCRNFDLSKRKQNYFEKRSRFSKQPKNDVAKITRETTKKLQRFKISKLSRPGNALERVQRVHEPADLWDITFCTR